MSRDKFQTAKTAQGYVGALERPRCDNCKHCVECYGSTQQCRIGAFLVTRYGHCQRWEARPPASFKPPE